MRTLLREVADSFVPLLLVFMASAAVLISAQVETRRRTTQDLLIRVEPASADDSEGLDEPPGRRLLAAAPLWPAGPATGRGKEAANEWLRRARAEPRDAANWAALTASLLVSERPSEALALKARMAESMGLAARASLSVAELSASFPKGTEAQRDALARLLFNLGLAHEEVGDAKWARQAYEAAAAADGRLWQIPLRLASLAGDDGQREAGRRAFAQALMQVPADEQAAANVAAGVQLWRAGDVAGAEQAFRQSVQLQPQGLRARLGLAIVLARGGRGDQAEPLFQALLADEPANARTHYHYGALLETRGRPLRALDHYRTAILYEPRFAAARWRLGQLLLQRSRVDEAAVQFAWLRSFAPRHPEYAHAMGRVRWREGRLAMAVPLFEEAIRLRGGEFIEAWIDLGGARKDAGSLVQAERAYHSAIRLAPDNADGHYQLGRLYTDWGKPKMALTALGRARELGREDAQVWLAVAECREAIGQHVAAIDAYRTVVEREPENIHALNHLGLLLAGRGKDEEATEIYQRALRVEPENGRTWLLLGVSQQRLLNTPGALQAYESAVRVATHADDSAVRVEAYHAIGLLHGYRQEHAQALESYRQVILHRPDDAAARYGIARSLLELGSHDAARAEVRKLLAIDPGHAKGRQLRTLLERGPESAAPGAGTPSGEPPAQSVEPPAAAVAGQGS